ncbi:MAG: hypothetical protein DI570_05275 [Phenylobacterium zucineum]|nr:MAG: hypothetical protein DI570_05275 [Phenylobacterium zucineum]
MWVGAIAFALAGGAFLGLAAQSDHGAISASGAEAAAPPLQVELAALPEPPRPVAGRLDVRPGEAAWAAPRQQPRVIDPPRRQTPPSAGDDGAEESEMLDLPPEPQAPPENEPLGY